MALIQDPDQLTQGSEVTITTGTKIIKLNIAGNLSSDGVTLKCLYSFLKEEWKTDTNLIKYPFPMVPITDEQYEFVNGWNLDKTGSGDAYTPNLIRTGGWAVKNLSNNTTEMWAGVVTLGSIQPGGQVYFTQTSAGTGSNFNLTGAVNQAIQIVNDPNGDGNYVDGYDYRTYLNLFLRTQGNVYASSKLTDIGVTELTYQVYRFPLSDSDDLKITIADTGIDANSDNTADVAPFTGMSITWYASTQVRLVNGTNRNFHVIINGNSGTLEQIYQFVQWSLRKSVDIDSGAGTKIGKVTNELLYFVGENLKSKLDSTGGVYIDNIQSIDSNRITFIDDGGIERNNAFTANLTINFGANLVADTDAIYRVFFTNDDAGANLGNDYGTSGAITVNDASAIAMAGNISGAAQIQKTFDYDNNIQRGAGSEGDDAPITVVAIGLNTGQFVSATGLITRSTTNSVSLVASLERNYDNP